MAQKKQPGDNSGRSTAPTRGVLPNLPDPRAMESILHQMVGTEPDPGTQRGQAKTLLAQAFRETDPAERVKLAIEALRHWPDCADALVLLAEHAPGYNQALQLYRRALEAAERVLGPDTFRDNVGKFWGMLETRPYMRARVGLASVLWVAGKRDECITHMKEMIRLNPNDNQGIRYPLACRLMVLDRDKEVEELLAQFPDDSLTTWAYTKALLAFRQEGDTERSRGLLEAAKKNNPHVPQYLLSYKRPPLEHPSSYSPSEESEALMYLGMALPAWRESIGAISWIRANDERTIKRKAQYPPARGPLGFIKKWLTTKLTQQEDVWQVDSRRVTNLVEIGGAPVRMWLTLVASSTTRWIMGHLLSEDPPTPAQFWDLLAKAMEKPAAGEAHRPTEVQVRANSRWASLRTHVEELGIRWNEAESLDDFDAAFADGDRQIAGDGRLGLLDIPGIEPKQLGSFYEAAAEYYRQTPWHRVGYESVIKMECDKFPGGARYGVVLGQSGLTNGFAVYDNMRIIEGMWQDTAAPGDEVNGVTTVMFGEEWAVAPIDADAAQKHGWKVARADAYPFVLHGEKGGKVGLPTLAALQQLEIGLRAVSIMVQRRAQDDTTPEEITITMGGEAIKVLSSWIVR